MHRSATTRPQGRAAQPARSRRSGGPGKPGKPGTGSSAAAPRRSSRGRQAFSLLTLVLGLLLLLYPVASTLWNNHLAIAAAQAQRKASQQVPSETAKKELAAAKQWNKTHPRSRMATMPDLDTAAGKGDWNEYLKELDLTPAMGTITIPSQHIQLPIKHGTDGNTLRNNVGHLYNSQLPIGGSGTQAVLTGHTGLTDQTLFDNLDKLKKGDIFVVEVLGQAMQYRIHDIRVIKPDDVKQLLDIPGDDIVTLITCTPYGINSHRLLVSGERVPLQAGVEDVASASLGWQWWMWACIALSALLLALHARGWFRRKRRDDEQPDSAVPAVVPAPKQPRELQLDPDEWLAFARDRRDGGAPPVAPTPARPAPSEAPASAPTPVVPARAASTAPAASETPAATAAPAAEPPSTAVAPEPPAETPIPAPAAPVPSAEPPVVAAPAPSPAPTAPPVLPPPPVVRDVVLPAPPELSAPRDLPLLRKLGLLTEAEFARFSGAPAPAVDAPEEETTVMPRLVTDPDSQPSRPPRAAADPVPTADVDRADLAPSSADQARVDAASAHALPPVLHRDGVIDPDCCQHCRILYARTVLAELEAERHRQAEERLAAAAAARAELRSAWAPRPDALPPDGYLPDGLPPRRSGWVAYPEDRYEPRGYVDPRPYFPEERYEQPRYLDDRLGRRGYAEDRYERPYPEDRYDRGYPPERPARDDRRGYVGDPYEPRGYGPRDERYGRRGYPEDRYGEDWPRRAW